MVIPRNFELVRLPGGAAWVRSDVRAWIEPTLTQLALSAPIEPAPDEAPLAGGRGGVVATRVGEQRIVIRSCRRGGLPGRFVRDLYLGLRPRPFAELARTEILRQAGVPVAEIYAAVVRWIFPGCYRGWVISKRIDESQTLWTWVRGEPAATEKREALLRVAEAVRRLHAAGMVHPDLNLNNILVRIDASGLQVWLLDFDRSLQPARIGSDIERLERSVHKLDPERTYITGDDFAFLRRAYAEATCE